MKIVSNKFFTFIVFLLGVCNAVAQSLPGDPPCPNDDCSTVPGTPIDDGVYILLIVAVLFGLYVVYSRNKKTETSV